MVLPSWPVPVCADSWSRTVSNGTLGRQLISTCPHGIDAGLSTATGFRLGRQWQAGSCERGYSCTAVRISARKVSGSTSSSVVRARITPILRVLGAAHFGSVRRADYLFGARREPRHASCGKSAHDTRDLGAGCRRRAKVALHQRLSGWACAGAMNRAPRPARPSHLVPSRTRRRERPARARRRGNRVLPLGHLDGADRPRPHCARRPLGQRGYRRPARLEPP